MTIEQLQAENTILKQDFKSIKNSVLVVTNLLGISTNGVFNTEFNQGQVINKTIKLLGEFGRLDMTPEFMKSTKSKEREAELKQKVEEIKNIFPTVLKYKDL